MAIHKASASFYRSLSFTARIKPYILPADQCRPTQAHRDGGG
jgi:hypothetical protein